MQYHKVTRLYSNIKAEAKLKFHLNIEHTSTITQKITLRIAMSSSQYSTDRIKYLTIQYDESNFMSQ